MSNKRIKLDDELGDRVKAAQLNAKINLQLQSTAQLEHSLRLQCEQLRDDIRKVCPMQLAMAQSQEWLQAKLSLLPELRRLHDRLLLLHPKLVLLQSRHALLNNTVPTMPFPDLPLKPINERVMGLAKRNELRVQVAELESNASHLAKQVKLVKATRHRQAALAIFTK